MEWKWNFDLTRKPNTPSPFQPESPSDQRVSDADSCSTIHLPRSVQKGQRHGETERILGQPPGQTQMSMEDIKDIFTFDSSILKPSVCQCIGKPVSHSILWVPGQHSLQQLWGGPGGLSWSHLFHIANTANHPSLPRHRRTLLKDVCTGGQTGRGCFFDQKLTGRLSRSNFNIYIS